MAEMPIGTGSPPAPANPAPTPEVTTLKPVIAAQAPQAEPGESTSEYRDKRIVQASIALVTAVVNLLTVVGVHGLEQLQATLNATSVPAIAVMEAGFALSRGIRKRGTAG